MRFQSNNRHGRKPHKEEIRFDCKPKLSEYLSKKRSIGKLCKEKSMYGYVEYRLKRSNGSVLHNPHRPASITFYGKAYYLYGKLQNIVGTANNNRYYINDKSISYMPSMSWGSNGLYSISSMYNSMTVYRG